MDMKLNYKIKKRKKGLSTVVVSVIMIALVITAIVIVWGVVNNLIKGKMTSSEACFGNFGKVNINSQYTCYDTSGDPDVFQFSIEIGDIDVEKVIVSISGAAAVKSYTIPGTYSDVKNYGTGGTYGEGLTLPEKNGGLTYITNFFIEQPDSIKIAPVINGQQCEVSDTLSEIESCY